METFSKRKGHFEVRSCDNNLMTKRHPHTTAEIIAHDYGMIYTIAYWIKDEYGYSLNFVGNRPFVCFQFEPEETFFMLAEYGQHKLDEAFVLAEEEA